MSSTPMDSAYTAAAAVRSAQGCASMSLSSACAWAPPPWAPQESGSLCLAGDLIVEGGGFCGARTQPLDLDLSAFDGIRLRVRSDGQTFKLNIKTVSGKGEVGCGIWGCCACGKQGYRLGY